MKVFVRTLTNQKYELDVDPDAKIELVKDLIHKEHNLGEPASQKLIYSGKILKDDQSLNDAKIREGGFIVLMIKKESPATSKPAVSESKSAEVAPQPEASVAPVPVAASPAAADVEAPAADPGHEPEDDEDDDDAADANGNAMDWLAEGGDGDEELDPAQVAEILNGLALLLQEQPELADQLVEALVHMFPHLSGQLQNRDNIMQALQEPEVLSRVVELMGALGGMEEFEEGDEHDHDHQEHVVHLTEEEMSAIGRLETLGFSRALCVQAYLLCDRNEDLAASYLFDNMDGGDVMDL